MNDSPAFEIGQALVSIHDVMPDTIDRVQRILDWLDARGAPPPLLLVVPGKPWSTAGLQRLAAWNTEGCALAAHGWNHQTQPRKPYHRLHAALLSRNVAEHLDHGATGVVDLMRRSHAWFAQNGLPAPEVYVPPAWALGKVSSTALEALPFRVIETTRGLVFPGAGRRILPLAGFEADTAWREAFLRRWNRAQSRRATRSGRPLRISIHPDDLELRLADQMDTLIRGVRQFRSYGEMRAEQRSGTRGNGFKK